MKTPFLIGLILSVLLVAPAQAVDAPPANSLFVILYKQGPAWKEGVPMKQQDAMAAHYKYMKLLFMQGTSLDAGPTLDEPGGVVILKAKDLDAAKAIMAADPSITQQMFVGEVHSWSPTFRTPQGLPGDAPVPGVMTRDMKDNVVTSSADPKVQITLPTTSTYFGSDTWYLTAYQDSITFYLAGEVDAGRDVQRLYWVQFEAYSPAFPDYHHTYDSVRHVSLGGMDFLMDTWAGYTDSKDEPDSDTAHVKAALAKSGYTLPKSMLTVRFVYLMDGARKELMLIYKEPTPAGLTADDLKPGGKAYSQWPAIEKGLIERAQQSFQIQ